jgi:hypothetical protein
VTKFYTRLEIRSAHRARSELSTATDSADTGIHRSCQRRRHERKLDADSLVTATALPLRDSSGFLGALHNCFTVSRR